MGITFENWTAKANAICERKFGVGLDDLADGPSRDAYNDGLTPLEYVTEILPEHDDLLGAFFSDW
tara:strand:+ start:393 stop:587 length:195 start_codon:yes stop_codon:yes gene_type:complete